MSLSEKDFHVLEALDSQEITTQRQLATHAGLSLGQVNYVLKSLLEKGLVKIGNFRKSPHKIGYAYILTPKGLEAKSKLAGKFILARLREYHELRGKIFKRLMQIENKHDARILFLGPGMIRDLLETIIRDERMKLRLVKHCRDWEALHQVDPAAFDVAVLVNADNKQLTSMSQRLGISPKRFVLLW